MTKWYEDDLVHIIDGDFSVEATLNGKTIFCIFDNEYLSRDVIDEAMASKTPQALCKTTDVSDAAIGNIFSVSSVDWKIRGIEDDGTGVTRLILSRD